MECPSRFTNPSMDFQLTYNIKMKALTIIKKTKSVVWLMMVFLPLLWACEKEQIGCLPYQGEIFPVSQKGMFGVSCNGIVIKVTNTSVNSFYDWGGGTEQNVITARIPEGMGFEDFFGYPIDPTKAKQRFYFDFRELREDEYNICTMEYSEPSRVVYMTMFSMQRCNNKPLN